MDHEWADIYTHVSCTVICDWFKEDRFEDVKAPRQLSDYLQRKLDGLRRHIYEKRREMLKTRLRKEKKEAA